MRDVALATIIFGSLPLILVRPWIGIIMWSWISFMNPHRMGWNFMYDMNVAMMVALATLVGWLITKDERRIPASSITVLMFALISWCGITTTMALQQPEGTDQFIQFAKIILMTYVAISLINNPDRLRALMWVTVLSIGFFSVKGGAFTLITGGQFRVWGPPDTFIEDNNALALATLMTIPLMVYLGQTAGNRWIRHGMYICAFLSLISVVGSYSRGGFVGMAAIGVLLWWRAKRRVLIGVVVGAIVVTSAAIVPQKWLERMDTIQNYEEDASASSRLVMWGHALRIAGERPITGGGFGVFEHGPTYDKLSPEIEVRRNVHSIYFEMLGTQGYTGLIIFLLLGLSGLLVAGKIKRLTRDKDGFENEYRFANLIQISLVAYAVSGTFQNLSTYDLYYTLLAMIALQYSFVRRKLASTVAKTASQTSAAAAVPTLPAQMPGRSFLRTPSP